MNKSWKYGLFLSLSIASIELITIFVFKLLTLNIRFFSFLSSLILVLLVAISSAIISILVINTVPYFKKFLLQHRSLIRFQSLSHPLLVQLSIEAPGTYHHSLTVGNLAYKAARSINADAMLARVGAYYHDIGKLKDPFVFIENKKTLDEAIKLKSLTEIKKMANLIISHVEYGLYLAKNNNIPIDIMTFIAEHHGTTLAIYFYDEAKKIDSSIEKKYFCYAGPKPLTRETAIVMLADAIEAKIRLCQNINVEEISIIIDETIEQRLKEKQLELSGLNHYDITKIRQAFIDILSSIHHQRINYKDAKSRN